EVAMDNIVDLFKPVDDIEGGSLGLFPCHHTNVAYVLLQAVVAERHDQEIPITIRILSLVEDRNHIHKLAISEGFSDFKLTVSSGSSRQLQALNRNIAVRPCAFEHL